MAHRQCPRQGLRTNRLEATSLRPMRESDRDEPPAGMLAPIVRLRQFERAPLGRHRRLLRHHDRLEATTRSAERNARLASGMPSVALT